MKLSNAWLLYKTEKQLEFSPHTIKAYELQMNLLIRHFGDIDIEDITYSDLKQYLNKDIGRLKPSSLGHRVRFIRSVFRWCHEEGITKTNESHKLKEPKQGKRVPKFIVEEDLERLKESCINAKEKSLICLLYSSGARIGEIYQMDKKSINWEKKYITVIGKGDKEREVPFDTITHIWLKKYIDERTDNEECLFPTDRKPYRRSSIAQLRWIVKRIAKRANIKTNIYPHRFRHSFCQHLIDRGCPIEVVSSLAGHQKISTTQLYLSLSGEHRREIYRKYF